MYYRSIFVWFFEQVLMISVFSDTINLIRCFRWEKDRNLDQSGLELH